MHVHTHTHMHHAHLHTRRMYISYARTGVFPLKFLGGVAFGGEHEDIWEETLKVQPSPSPSPLTAQPSP